MLKTKESTTLADGNLACTSADSTVKSKTVKKTTKTTPAKPAKKQSAPQTDTPITEKVIVLENVAPPILEESISPTGESIIEIPLMDLHPPDFHPFYVNDDEAMQRLTDSIKQFGVREPGIVRPRPDGGYELLIGNRRKRACELAKLTTMPVIVRKLDDDDSVIAMVDSNLEQRDKLLPSERAWAYRIKMEALNHKGIKGDKLSAEIVASQNGNSKSQVFRMIRLTNLIAGLLDKVDANKLAFNPAVELSILSQVEQNEVVLIMEQYDMKPSLTQTIQLRKMKQNGTLSKELIHSVLSETKPKKSSANKDVSPFRKYFPKDYTDNQMNNVISSLLETWQAEQSKQSKESITNVDTTQGKEVSV